MASDTRLRHQFMSIDRQCLPTHEGTDADGRINIQLVWNTIPADVSAAVGLAEGLYLFVVIILVFAFMCECVHTRSIFCFAHLSPDLSHSGNKINAIGNPTWSSCAGSSVYSCLSSAKYWEWYMYIYLYASISLIVYSSALTSVPADTLGQQIY